MKLILLSMSLFFLDGPGAVADTRVVYAPKAVHNFTDGTFLNDDVNIVSLERKGVGIFTFNNSFHEQSFGAYTTETVYRTRTLKLEIMVGAVYGYRSAYYVDSTRSNIVKRGPIVVRPVVAPSLTYRASETTSYTLSQYGAATVVGVGYHF